MRYLDRLCLAASFVLAVPVALNFYSSSAIGSLSPRQQANVRGGADCYRATKSKCGESPEECTGWVFDEEAQEHPPTGERCSYSAPAQVWTCGYEGMEQPEYDDSNPYTGSELNTGREGRLDADTVPCNLKYDCNCVNREYEIGGYTYNHQVCVEPDERSPLSNYNSTMDRQKLDPESALCPSSSE